VELLAIGIGHDVTRYYERAVAGATITDADAAGRRDDRTAGCRPRSRAVRFDSDPLRAHGGRAPVGPRLRRGGHAPITAYRDHPAAQSDLR
jgi:hypothetical protein